MYLQEWAIDHQAKTNNKTRHGKKESRRTKRTGHTEESKAKMKNGRKFLRNQESQKQRKLEMQNGYNE